MTVNADDEILTETPVSALESVSISGRTSPVTGTAAYTATTAGTYMLRVRYYARGQAVSVVYGKALWRVTAPVVTDPPPPVTPQPPTPQPPVTPQGDPVPAKLALTKRALRTVVKPGQLARFRLTVRNVSKVTAIKVTVCDRLPARTQYVAATRKVNFRGARACVNVGNLTADEAVTFTITLRVDRTAPAGRIVNHATATATNAASVNAQANVKVPRISAPRVHAPVTG